ncbi:MAG: hypothetical protein V8T45_03890 [Oscillospiraceae bacterium]
MDGDEFYSANQKEKGRKEPAPPEFISPRLMYRNPTRLSWPITRA